MPDSICIGTIEGNVLAVDLETLIPCHGLIGGPACPPWSSTGNLAGDDDPRATVFWAVLRMVAAYRSKCPGFRFVILENVVGILKRYRGAEPAIDALLASLRNAVGPEWDGGLLDS